MFKFTFSPQFYQKSNTYNLILNNVLNYNPKVLPSLDETTLAVKFFVESVIKHNLTISSIQVDFFCLIDEKNSDEIKTILLPIFNKNKENRTEEEFNIIRSVKKILDIINLSSVYPSIKNNQDIFELLKEEYISNLDK